ncbi:MAG TPA: hypothetical protein V6D50_26855 [Chroococcales cyanobacterium]
MRSGNLMMIGDCPADVLGFFFQQCKREFPIGDQLVRSLVKRWSENPLLKVCSFVSGGV